MYLDRFNSRTTFRIKRNLTVLYPHLEQVVETPGEDDDVIDIQEGYNHNGSVANTCKRERIQI